MKIPKKLKVGGSIYKIKLVNQIEIDPLCQGLTRYGDHVIEISENQGKQSRELTFLHELVHALLFHFNYEQNEDLVERLAQALYMVIKDNPEVFNNGD